MHFLRVCTYTLPSSPANDHLWGDPGPPGKNIQRATYMSKRTHSTILNIFHECVTQYFLISPSQTPVVAYFLSGPKGKNAYVCTSLTTLTLTLTRNILSLFSLMNTCWSAYFLPGVPGNNTQRISYTNYHHKDTP